MGCYPSGDDWDLLEKGLTSEMAHNSYPTQMFVTKNQNIMIEYSNMTIEACANLCWLNTFKYAGLIFG